MMNARAAKRETFSNFFFNYVSKRQRVKKNTFI